MKNLLATIGIIGILMLPLTVYADTFKDKARYGDTAAYTNLLMHHRAAQIPVWQSDLITDKMIAGREEGLEMKGVIPELNAASGFLQAPLNTLIEETVARKIAAAKELKAKLLVFAYEVYDTDAVVSIVIKSEATTSAVKTEVSSINFNPTEGRTVTVTEAVGKNIVQLADKLLIEHIRRNPENYIHGFSGLLEDQAFYMTDDRIVFLFNEYAPGLDAPVNLELWLSDIVSSTVSAQDYYIKPEYRLKMVPLRQVCNDLGYEVDWSADDGKIFIYKDGRFVMELTPGVNNYLRDKKLVRSLEAAPEIIDDVTYVPISFFDQILSLVTYSIDTQDNITFSSYIVMD